MQLEIPQEIQQLIEQLNQNGYEAYVVGGAVRSQLLHLPVHDYDLTTNAIPREMEEVFHSFRTIETGIKHGTITVLTGKYAVEITTYRTDGGYQDHRHPDQVSFTRSLREDCARRDFTINALCYHPQEGILDFFHGQEDLKHGIIRAIGSPQRRFDEDALRILRAIRFAARLGFTIEPATEAAMIAQKDLLSFISEERIKEEFFGFLDASEAAGYLVKYRSVFTVFLPELAHADEASWQAMLAQVKASKPECLVRFALILRLPCFAKPHRVMKRFTLSNQEITVIQDMHRLENMPLETRSDVRKVLNQLHSPFPSYLNYRKALNNALNDLQVMKLYEKIRTCHDPISLKDLAINGHDMLALGFEGKEISQTLQECLNAVMEDRIANSPEELRAYVLKLRKSKYGKL